MDLYLDEQSEGAWIGLGLLALWVGRRHLKQVFALAATGKGKLDDSKEPMAYKWAIWGIVGGVLFLIFFAVKAGFSLWVFLLFIAIYFLMAISLTKVRAGLGPPMHEVIFKDPATTMVSALGTRTVGAKNLTLMSFLYWLNRVNTSHPMPNQLEAFRISEQAQLNSRKLTVVMLAALAVSIVTTWTVYYSHAYERGAGVGGGGIAWECFNRLQRWLNSPTEYNYPAYNRYGHWIRSHPYSIRVETAFSLVALSSNWVCNRDRQVGRPVVHLVSHASLLGAQVGNTTVWWIASLSKGNSLFCGLNLGRLFDGLRMGHHWGGCSKGRCIRFGFNKQFFVHLTLIKICAFF